MSRYEVYEGRYAPDRYVGTSPGTSASDRSSRYRARISDMRDRHRTVLSTAEFLPSDIMTWNAVGGQTYGGDAFLVEHYSGGVPTGKAWLHIFTRPDTDLASSLRTVTFGEVIGSNISTTIDDFFINNDGSVASFNSAQGVIAHHYNNDTRDSVGNVRSMIVSCTHSVGNPPTANQIIYNATFEKQIKIVSYANTGVNSGTAAVQLKRGPKPILGDSFTQVSPVSTITMGTSVYDAMYDMAFDDWNGAKYALPLSTSAGAGSFVAGSAVDQSAGTGDGMQVIGPTGTGIFRRDSGSKLFLTNITGSFQVSDNISAAGGSITRTISAVGTRDFAPTNIVGGNTNYPFNIVNRNISSTNGIISTNGTAGFMPKEPRLFGYVYITGITNGASRDNPFCHVLQYDNVKPFMQYMYSDGKKPVMSRQAIYGEILTPYLVGDTRKSATISITMNHDSDEVGTTLVEKITAYTGDVSPGTVATNWTLRSHNLFSIDNAQSETTTEFSWDLIPLDNPTEFKGYLDSNVMRVGAAEDDHLGLLLSGPDGPFIKYHARYLFPWVPSKPAIFGPKWSEELDDSIY